MSNLPIEFINRMEDYLKERSKDFFGSLKDKATKGIRINPLKSSEDVVKKHFEVFEKSEFSKYSFLTETEKVGNMPLHAAGAFYSQEPSASSAVTVLDPKPGDKVLDLCAAPGGKSTQIGGALMGKGLLWSNEIVKSRANILLSNIERMGIRNAVVSSLNPEVICDKLTGYFDKILVDAPCSGEGMFRKNPEAITEWTLEHVDSCSIRQLKILNSAAKALKENGVLVYSTCTFSKEENENVCTEFLEENKDFELVYAKVSFGEKAMGMDAVRIYPSKTGEGHFVAKFIKNAETDRFDENYDYKKENKDAKSLYKELFFEEFGIINDFGDKIIILPHDLPNLKGLNVLRAGVELGKTVGKRIEPSHNLFTAQNFENCRSIVSFNSDDKILHSFLKGEEIPVENKKGYTAVSVENAVLGFGKASNGVLKNKYPKGLRFK